MKILIVGGAGYVGGAVTDHLMETPHSIRVFDALLYEESYRKSVDFIYGDVRDHKLLRPQLEWADVVVWLAALVGDGACALNPEIANIVASRRAAEQQAANQTTMTNKRNAASSVVGRSASTTHGRGDMSVGDLMSTLWDEQAGG